MALTELALEIYIVMMCLNGGILIVDSLIDTPLITPFDTANNVTGITTGPVTDIFNSTTFGSDQTLVGNLTSNSLSNSTLGGDESESFTPFDTVFFPLTLLWGFIQFVTGGFVFQVLALFGFPAIFTFALQGIFGILLARLILYYVWGR